MYKITKNSVRPGQMQCCALALIVMSLFAAGEARAEIALGAEASVNHTLEDVSTQTGWGVDLVGGPRLSLAIIALTAELSLGRHEFGGTSDVAIYRGMVGGRFAAGTIFQPSVFAHIGVGHLGLVVPDSDTRSEHAHVATDAGLALDFTAIPLINVGIQGSYNNIAGTSSDPAFSWIQAGLHATLIF